MTITFEREKNAIYQVEDGVRTKVATADIQYVDDLVNRLNSVSKRGSAASVLEPHILQAIANKGGETHVSKIFPYLVDQKLGIELYRLNTMMTNALTQLKKDDKIAAVSGKRGTYRLLAEVSNIRDAA